jgi:hypothetical protein
MIKPRGMRNAGHVAPMGERRDAYRVYIEERVEKRPLKRLRHILEKA